MPTEPARLSQVLYPSATVGDDANFFATVLGLEPLVVDGTRFALMGADGGRLALASGSEAIAGSTPVAVFAVPDVDQTVELARDNGGTVVVTVHDGPHERRAALADRSGNRFVVYSTDNHSSTV